jgi:hypothetical protein
VSDPFRRIPTQVDRVIWWSLQLVSSGKDTPDWLHIRDELDNAIAALEDAAEACRESLPEKTDDTPLLADWVHRLQKELDRVVRLADAIAFHANKKCEANAAWNRMGMTEEVMWRFDPRLYHRLMDNMARPILAFERIKKALGKTVERLDALRRKEWTAGAGSGGRPSGGRSDDDADTGAKVAKAMTLLGTDEYGTNTRKIAKAVGLHRTTLADQAEYQVERDRLLKEKATRKDDCRGSRSGSDFTHAKK